MFICSVRCAARELVLRGLDALLAREALLLTAFVFLAASNTFQARTCMR